MRDRALIFFSSLLVWVQLFITYPAAVWKNNKYNFEASLTDAFPVMGLVGVAIIIVSLSLAMLVPKNLRARVSAAFVILAAVIFIQQNYLTWNYGILDGLNLDFSKNRSRGFIDLGLWLAGLAGLIWGAKFIRRHSVNILLGISAITVIIAGVNIASYGPTHRLYSIDEAEKFKFSSKENLILFIFDGFQMDVLLELAEAEPKLFEPMEGFTLYENNAAVFAKTYPTMPLFLTGRRYKKEEPILDFFKSAYENSLMEEMQEAEWDIGLYPNITSYPSLVNAVDIRPGIMDNAVGGVAMSAKIDTYLQALDLSLFRAAPHQMKKTVFNKGQFWVRRENTKSLFSGALGQSPKEEPFKYTMKGKHRAVAFKDLLNKHGQLSVDDPAFRLYHLMVPHAPYVLDKNLHDIEAGLTFESFRDYSLAGVKLMGAYLQALKDIGAYENSTILILSDHGMGIPNNLQYNPETKSYEKAGRYGYQRAAAKSIFLVKKPGEHGAMQRSQKPVSALDVAPTLAAAAGLNGDGFEGKAVDALPETAERIRPFNYYDFSTWDSKYLDAFETFEINGDVRETASWKRIGLTKEKADFINPQSYRLGDILSYGGDVKTDSNFLNAFIDIDNYAVKPNFLNAEDGSIDITIPLADPPPEDVPLWLQFEVYSGQAVERTIIVNDYVITDFIEPKKRHLNKGYPLPATVHHGKNTLTIQFRPAANTDPAPLHLSSIKITQNNN